MSRCRDPNGPTRGVRSSSMDGSVETVSSIPSIPSIKVPCHESSSSIEEKESKNMIPKEVNFGDDNDVSVDHERQLVLLLLLAQVCALHDPTPRTFT